jgi:hypothetical protein
MVPPWSPSGDPINVKIYLIAGGAVRPQEEWSFNEAPLFEASMKLRAFRRNYRCDGSRIPGDQLRKPRPD